MRDFIFVLKKDLIVQALVYNSLIKMENGFWVHFLQKCMIKVIILILREKKLMKNYVKNMAQKFNFKKIPCLKMTRRKFFYSSNCFFFFSFSDCCLANSNSSFVCLNFFNLLVFYNLCIKTAQFFSILSKRKFKLVINIQQSKWEIFH